MQRVLRAFIDFLKNPINYLLTIGVAFSFYKFSVEGENKWTIRSDGSGYYAYLPALIIYNDPTFVSSTKAEAKVHNGTLSDNFLFKDQAGRTYNKFFPGEAVLQAPFFLLAHFIASISGAQTTGYSEIYQFFFWIGAMFYAILGLVYYQRFLNVFSNRGVNIKWIFSFFILATPIFFYLFLTPSFSHLYSFFLFSIFLFQVQKWAFEKSTKRNILIGFLLGMIFLVRPTNLVVLIVLPMFWYSGRTFWDWIRKRIMSLSFVLSILLPFVLVTGILPLCWHWQTGNWLVWSYRGEGFNWMEPSFIRALFSFRSGLFLHTPVMVFSVLGIYFWFRENRFQTIIFIIFCLFSSWIIFSWWCWDYEATFGNRPFTEHFLIMGLPIFFLSSKKEALVSFLTFFFALVGTIRLTTYFNEVMVDQRFKSDNYIQSLQFWKDENKNRWFFSEACEPYGKMRSRETLLQMDELLVKSTDEYVATNLIQLPEKRNGKRYFVRMTCEKRIFGTEKFTDVFFVVDAYNAGFENRNFKIMPLYNDIYEGKKAWKQLTFETQIYDYMEKCTEAKIFVWNPGKRHFELKNIRIELLVFGN